MNRKYRTQTFSNQKQLHHQYDTNEDEYDRNKFHKKGGHINPRMSFNLPP